MAMEKITIKPPWPPKVGWFSNWAIQPGHVAEPSHPRQKVFKPAMDGEETDPAHTIGKACHGILSENWLWRIYVHKPISIYLLIYYISYIVQYLSIYIYTYIYTHTHNTHMFVDPYPRFQSMIIIFRNSKSHVDSSAPTGLPRARVPSQRPWKWVEETRSSHLGINGLPKPWWTSHVDEDYGKSCKRRSATECSRGTQPQVFIKENQLELELFLVAKASKRERFRGQILIPNKVL